MGRTRITLSDVASSAGVSVSTASRVLHGGAGVREVVAGRVREAATQLGYSVNQQARSLRLGRSDVIGVVVEDFTIPFFGEIVAVAESYARERGHSLVIACAGTGATSQEPAVRSLLERDVAGLVVSNGAGPAPSGYLRRVAADLPVVVVDAPKADAHADCVTVDNHAGAREATRHLLAQGHRDVLFVGSAPTARTVGRRHAGYLRAVRDAGLTPTEAHTVWAGHETESVTAGVTTALREMPEVTAVFSSGSRTTPGSLSAMVRTGRRDVAFVGFDDVMGADAFDPGLTVVDQHPEEIGSRAVRLLFERIDGYTGPPRHVVVPFTLRERGSGERAPSAAPGEPARSTQRDPAGRRPSAGSGTTTAPHRVAALTP